MKKLKPKARYTPADQDGTLGVQVVFWRESRKMSQGELAELLGVSARQLRRVERAHATPAPAYIHWALKGLDSQTRQMRHMVIKSPADIKFMGGQALLLEPIEERFYDPVSHIKVWM